MENVIELYGIETQLKLLGVEGTQAIINEIVKKINKDNIVQTTGDSEDKIMSQKAITNALENLTVGESDPIFVKVKVGEDGYGVQYKDNENTEVGNYSFSEGINNIAKGWGSHAEGYNTIANGYISHAEGYFAYANEQYSHAEGWNTYANGYVSHAEGAFTCTYGQYSHVEGNHTCAKGNGSHAEGYYTYANGDYSHVEGYGTYANRNYSHAEGFGTYTNGESSHAEGQYTYANGNCSHAEGYNTYAYNRYEHASGIYNISTTDDKPINSSETTLFSVGNGSFNSGNPVRHNAFEIKQNGDIYIPDTNAEGEYYQKPMIKLQDALNNSGGGYTPNEWFGTKDEFEMLDSKEEGKWYYIYED